MVIRRDFWRGYITGLIWSDGHIEKGRNRVILVSKNYNMLKDVYRIVEELYHVDKLEEYTRKSGKKSIIYAIRITSQELTIDLVEHFGIPKGKKSHKSARITDKNEEEIKGFIMGLIEGWRNNDRNTHGEIQIPNNQNQHSLGENE